jgi:trimethylamine:corrinoid methyltransferase-like protein
VVRRANPVRYEEAAKDLRAHYEATGTRELSEYTYRVAHLAGSYRQPGGPSGRGAAAFGHNHGTGD